MLQLMRLGLDRSWHQGTCLFCPIRPAFDTQQEKIFQEARGQEYTRPFDEAKELFFMLELLT